MESGLPSLSASSVPWEMCALDKSLTRPELQFLSQTEGVEFDPRGIPHSLVLQRILVYLHYWIHLVPEVLGMHTLSAKCTSMPNWYVKSREYSFYSAPFSIKTSVMAVT